ncbi:MAG: hypothetical protein GX416_08175 [Bacteroidales bacterium]|nr:hypothetical protein [Bacteroidales bacterium]
MKHPLSKAQIICILLLWAGLMYIVLRYTQQINGSTILTLLIATGFIFVPIYKSIQKHNNSKKSQ